MFERSPPIDPRQRTEAEQLIDEIQRDLRANPEQRFLILDDGGEMIEAVNHFVEANPHLADHFAGVEQTRHGSERLKKAGLRFYVSNVGEDWAKQMFESPSIGHGTVARIVPTIRRYDDPSAPRKRVLVVGAGNVGSAVLRELRASGYDDICAYDISPKARTMATANGIRVVEDLSAGLRDADVVVGATGGVFVNESNANLLKKSALLINVASRHTEFDPRLRARAKVADQDGYAVFNGKVLLTGDPRDRERLALVVPTQNGDILIANGTHPINFDGRLNPTPPRYIQLPLGLLFLGAIRATEGRVPGLHPLSLQEQEAYVQEVEADLRRTNESLRSPSFDPAESFEKSYAVPGIK